MADFIDVPGRLGSYRYWQLANVSATTIQAVAGNYMFMRLTNAGWVPIYVGIANDLSERLPSHDMWPVAQRNGATAIFAHTQSSDLARISEESDLIAYWNPPCNTQHRTGQSILGGYKG
jgi:hypothetical protein